MKSTHAKHHPVATLASVAAVGGALALCLIVAGCATKSVGELPLLQETLHRQCSEGAIKECRVWGGNKFSKRYEYCGCRER
jgi:hypothetical protein